METPNIELTEDTIFAFCYGLSLALSKRRCQCVMNPILERMNAILGDPKRSLVKAHDDHDMNQFRHLRALEAALCAGYLEMVTK